MNHRRFWDKSRRGTNKRSGERKNRRELKFNRASSSPSLRVPCDVPCHVLFCCSRFLVSHRLSWKLFDHYHFSGVFSYSSRHAFTPLRGSSVSFLSVEALKRFQFRSALRGPSTLSLCSSIFLLCDFMQCINVARAHTKLTTAVEEGGWLCSGVITRRKKGNHRKRSHEAFKLNAIKSRSVKSSRGWEMQNRFCFSWKFLTLIRLTYKHSRADRIQTQ